MYRFSVFSYRIGEIAEMFFLIFMWLAIYSGQEAIRGYSYNEMITYILLGNLINVIVRNWLSEVVADNIKQGILSQFLVKPMEYFRYIMAREIGRISFAFFMSVLSQILVMLFFLKYFIFNVSFQHLLVIIFIISFSFIIELLMSYLIGLTAFWTLEVDGIFTTVWRIKKLFSGGYFPLDFLPASFVSASFLLPFAYSFFIPVQIYLGKMSVTLGIKGILVQIFWILALYAIIKIVWKKGLKKYESVGI